MKLLLDTHAFLWALFLPEKLSQPARDALLEPQNQVYLSIITLWEISLKYSLNKLNLKGIAPDDLPELAEQSGFQIYPLRKEDVSSFYRLPRHSHKDPFDRLLIWQAIQNNLTLVSKDSSFSQYRDQGLSLFW